MEPDSPEHVLIAAAQAGDHCAFAELVRRHQHIVYAVTLRLLSDRDLAEDITQETFIRAYLGLKLFRGRSFRAWVLRIAHNAALDFLRAKARRPQLSLEQAPEQTAPDELERSVEQLTLVPVLEAALAKLPHEQRVVLLLADVEGLPYDEVAEVLALPIGTVKSRLARARVRLRAILLNDPRLRELLEARSRLPTEEWQDANRST